MQPTSEPSVLLSTNNQIATLTLNRPAKLNAFDGEMIASLARALRQIREKIHSVRCLVVTGSGRGFCAGADLDYLYQLRRENRIDEFQRLLEDGRDVVTQLRELPIPVIAAVNGPAAGGGASIALACDLRIACASARFTQAFAKLGVHADFGATFFLPRIVGEAKARELMFTGETIDAAEALRLGLVSEVVPDSDLAAVVENRVALLASRAPLSLQLMKQTFVEASRSEFQKSLDRELDAQLECFQSYDLLRGIEAFLQKRHPSFQGN